MSKNFNVVPENTNNYRNYKKKSNSSGFEYIEQNVISYNAYGSAINKKTIKIKLDSKGNPEKYSNGRPVILGEHGYPVNNKGQILSFDQKTGDLKRNSSKNPYVYNPYPGGFKIPQNEIIYRYPQLKNAQIQPRNNKQTSFLSSEGPGQTQVPTVFGIQPGYTPPGGFKVHTKPPESVFKYNNRKPGNKENNSSPLLQQPGNSQNNSNKSALSRLFGEFSILKKKK